MCNVIIGHSSPSWNLIEFIKIKAKKRYFTMDND